MLLDLLPLLQRRAIDKTGGATLGLDAGGTTSVDSESSVSATGSFYTRIMPRRLIKAGGASIGLHGGGIQQVTVDLRAVRRAQIREADELLLVGVL